MNFDFSDEQKLLQTTVHDFLRDRDALRIARHVVESGASYAPELWREVAKMGWLGAALPERYGGAAFGYLELVLIAEELGRSLAPVPFSASLLAMEALLLAGTEEQKERYLPRLASGELIGTFALHEPTGQLAPLGIHTRFANRRLLGTKVPVAAGDLANVAVVAANTEADGIGLVLAELNSTGVSRTRLDSFDPTQSQAALRFDDAPADSLQNAGDGWEQIDRLLDRAAVLIAFEQLGGAEQCLEMARDHALSRYQFGRPIGSFQAIKHRLADMFVGVELARAHCYYAAWALSSAAPELAVAACGARISATEAYEFCARENLQIHGGIGFTWEADPHLFYRRSKNLALSLGSVQRWRDQLVQRLTHSPVMRQAVGA